jgi:crotonobetainyl-CoA:carnitine CoA-transferase CaiB-like acyl-CoA transferase
MEGPLASLRVVELQGRGPGPFCAMVLADLGAEVVRVARPSDVPPDDGASGTERMIRGHRRIDLAGALAPLRRGDDPPAPPLNLLGDYGGGGMLAVVGVLGALVERSVSGRGQVVDAAMVDGVALLTTLLHGMRAEGRWSGPPGSNVLAPPTTPPSAAGEQTSEVLADWGFAAAEVEALLGSGAVRQAPPAGADG